PPTWPGGYPPAPAAPRSHPSASYPPASYPPTSAPPAVADLVPDPQTYYGADPAAAAAPPSIAAQPAAPISPAGAPGPVDVNTATAEQLAALPAFDLERARRVLAERQARGGFGSVAEFAAAAGLAPHEFARIRGQLVCAPGRPGPGQPPPHGRVLDY
ncbi:MAG: helix-hairpin-helix domain-containing protein, partial [Micromonosporaceae bacterium]